MNSLGSLISTSKSILLLLPTNPHFDHVAAGLGLYLALGEKQVSISCPSPMLVEFNRLVGVNKVSSEMGNKNLTIKFIDYVADDVERVSYDIENGEFRLTVVPKPGVAAPKKDQMTFSYTGISADLVILVGGGHEGHFPSLDSKDIAGAKLVHVGTRPLTNQQNQEILSLAKPASSVSELVASYLKESDIAFEQDMATNLLMGIEEGSRNFGSVETTAETFTIVADLMKAGGRRSIRQDRVDRRNFPQGSIPGEALTPAQNVAPRAPKAWTQPKIYKGSGTPVS